MKKKIRIERVKQNIIDGFYGGKTFCGRNHKPINQHIIGGWIKKCHQKMNESIINILELKEKNIETLWNEH